MSTNGQDRDARRLLVVDDNQAIHEDFRKVLAHAEEVSVLNTIEAEVFGDELEDNDNRFQIDSAFQGQEGAELVRRAVAEGRPYAMAFVDMRMPPGWDGLKTVEHLWRADPDLQVVICTAYSDHSWDEIDHRLEACDRLLILKKPFDNAEISQLAHTLTQKWSLQREVRQRLKDLDALVLKRTEALQEANRKLTTEMEERARIEQELRLAHKLEAVGQLAAGIAHEINTPMQFIGDNVHFLREVFGDLLDLVDKLFAVRDAAKIGRVAPALYKAVEQAEESADLSYLRERTPRAFERTLDGVSRVSTIVSAMKAFSHPQNDKAPIDLNNAIQTTLTVARNEYKYIADVDTEFGDLPLVTCHGGDMNQVFLNLIVNAAHAIEAANNGAEGQGRIRVQTRREGDMAVIAIADTGCGIPEEVQHRVFDPFFTTKEVGRGTGQGLSLAHTIIVDKHGGALSFETEVGRGTTFFVRIPIDDRSTNQGGATP
jgi:signal transduction histidine kinase